MQKKNILLVSVIVLLVINLSMVSFWAYKHHQWKNYRMNDKNMMQRHDQYLIEALKFDEVEAKIFHDLKDKQRAKILAFENEQNQISKEYFSMLDADTSLTSKKDSLANLIGQIQVQKAAFMFQHFKDLKKLAGPERQAQFDSILPILVKAMFGKAHGNRPSRGK